MRTFAVLPIKSFAAAKTRLAADLGVPQGEVAEEMAVGVLSALCAAASLEGVKAALLEPFGDGGRVVHVQVSVVDGSYHETDTDQQDSMLGGH